MVPQIVVNGLASKVWIVPPGDLLVTKAGGGGGEDAAMARGSLMVQTNRGAWCEGAEGEL